jgi:site-specific recombinase XerD
MDVYPHKLRHTFATLMIQGSCTLPALAKMMGHSDIKTTMVYLWVSNEDLMEQIGKHPLGFTSNLPHRSYPLKPF